MDTTLHSAVSPDALGPGAKRVLLGTMLGAHLLASWALLQVPAVREAAVEVAPMMVDLIAPKPEAPPPPPPPKAQPKTPPPPPAAVIAARPPSVPTVVPVFTAPPPPPEPAPLPPPEAPPAPPAPTPPAPPALVVPPVPPAPAPAAPRQVVLTDSDWVRVPEVEYPLASRRLKEEGTVVVRALIDTRGVPKQVVLQRSSGHTRLDQQALRAAMTARVRPRTENGVPFEFWIAMPLAFELED
jgi:periplasmic protein TonB